MKIAAHKDEETDKKQKQLLLEAYKVNNHLHKSLTILDGSPIKRVRPTSESSAQASETWTVNYKEVYHEEINLAETWRV